MVGIVLVSHSKAVAESVEELTKMMAPEAVTAAAGGMEAGGFGTSFERIQNAIDTVYSQDGVIVLMDMGSAVMTTEMVIEMKGEDNIKMADCPFVEGAVMATVGAQNGMSLDEILDELKEVGTTPKF